MPQRSGLLTRKKVRHHLRVGLITGLIAGSFLLAGNVKALTDPLIYQKPSNGTLTATEWNNLLNDFVAYRDGGKVGIGTTNPGANLHIYDTSSVFGLLQTASVSDSNLRFSNANQNWAIGIDGSASNSFKFSASTQTGVSDLVTILTNGDVGIGTTTPDYKLDVSGTGRFTQPVIVGTPTAAGHATTKSYVDSTAVAAAGGGIPAAVNGYTLRASGTSWVANSNLYNNGTNVGIGTTNPAAKLDVNGTIHISGGNEATPSLAIVDDNMGFYKSGTGELSISLNGAERLRFLDVSSGNIKILPKQYSAVNTAASHPAYSFFDDANSGMFRYNQDILGFSTGGQTRIVIDANGNVGIGTTAPAYKLDVTGTGRFTQPVIVGAPTLDGHAATKNYVDSTIGGGSDSTVGYWTMNGTNISNSNTGNVGIGTNSPGVKLTTNASYGLPLTSGTDQTYASFRVQASTGNVVLDMGTAGGTSGTWLQTTNKTSLGSSYPLLLNPNGGNVGIGNTIPTYALDVTGTGRFTQPVLVGTPTAAGHATTKSYVDSTAVAAAGGGIPAAVNGYTLRASGTSWVANSNLYNNGTNVGIGTTAPVSQLHIEKNSAATLRMQTSVITPGETANLEFGISTNRALTAAKISAIRTDAGGANSADLAFYTSLGTASNERLRILANGNIGVGTTAPAYKLDVSGTGRFTQPVLVGAPTAAGHATTKSYVDSTAVSAAGGGVGAGTTGQTLRHNGTSWVANSVLFNNGTNVGIGTANPGAKLSFGSYYDSAGTNPTSHIRLFESGTTVYGLGVQSGKLLINANQSNGNIVFNAGSTNDAPSERMRITSSGNVGIGTSAPAYKLDVAGTGRFTQPVLVGTPTAAGHATTKSYVDSTAVAAAGGGIPAAVNGYTLRASGTSWIANSTLYNNGTNVGIGTTSPGTTLDVVSANANPLRIYRNSANSSLQVQNNATSAFFGLNVSNNIALGFSLDQTNAPFQITSGGNVGIGTTNPSEKLDVSGIIKASGGLSVASQFISDSIYAYTNGILVNTDIAVSDNLMIELYIEGNSYSSWGAIGGKVTTYNYVNNGYFVNSSYVTHGISPTEVRIFHHDGFVKFWMPQTSASQTYRFRLGTNRSSKKITSIQNLAMPTEGVTNEVVLTPKTVINNSVGIGTAAPAYTLDVSGTGRFTQPVLVGTPTAAGHATTKSYVDSTAVAAAGGGIPAAVNGYTLRASGTSWVANSVLFNNGTNVGIGTSNPLYKFTVGGGDLLITNEASKVVVGGYGGSGNVTFGSSGIAVPANGTQDYGFYSSFNAYRSNDGLWYNLRTNNASVKGINFSGGYGTGFKWRYQSNSAGVAPVEWTDLMSLTTSGNLGIGTTPPAYTLDVSGTGRFTQPVLVGTPTAAGHATTKSYVDSAAGGGIPAAVNGYTLRASGTSWVANSNLYNNGTNVGIGTTAPGAKLDISENTGGIIQLKSTAGTVVANGLLGKIQFYSSDASNNAAGVGAYISAQAANEVAPDQKTDLIFATAISPGATPASEKMRITSAGNVGIGTTAPAYKLDVSGTGRFTQPVLVGTPTAAGHATTKSYVDSTAVAAAGGGIPAAVNGHTLRASGTSWIANSNLYNNGTNVGIGTTAAQSKLMVVDRTANLQARFGDVNTPGLSPAIRFSGELADGTNRHADIQLDTVNDVLSVFAPSAGAPTNRAFNINTSGNVGIGTTAPAYKLDVSGTGRFTQPVLVATPTAAGHATTKSYVDSTAVSAAGGGVGAGTSGQTLRHDGTSWVANSLLYNNGTNVGVGTTAPVQKLDIAGAIKIANTTATCNTDQTGTIKYDSVSGQSYLCDGTRWLNQKNCGIMTDDEGNTYGTVQIGGQCWMAENINIGTMLPSPASEPTTTDQVIEKWCYNDSAANCETGGGLYNWNEAMRGSTVPGARGICPTGWHIPTDAEYNQLEKTVLGVIDSSNPQYNCDLNYSGWERCADSSGTATGGTYGVGASLKTVGLGSGVGAGNDLVGFAAKLPGYRLTNGTYSSLGSSLDLWSSTESSSTSAWRRHILSPYSTVRRVASTKTLGFSVRCLRD